VLEKEFETFKEFNLTTQSYKCKKEFEDIENKIWSQTCLPKTNFETFFDDQHTIHNHIKYQPIVKQCHIFFFLGYIWFLTRLKKSCSLVMMLQEQ